MAILSWLIIGLVAGFVARLVDGKGQGSLLVDVAVGMAGSVIAGLVMLSVSPSAGINSTTVAVALVVGAVTLVLCQALLKRRTSL